MKVHETAFIVSTYRSLHETISKDPYARLWNNDKTNSLLPEIFQQISSKEAILHAIRNRFFLEELTAFFKHHPTGTLINFGAGFSMYQFILPAHIHTIEIDKQPIIEYKKSQIGQWIKDGTLPPRVIDYHAVDFATNTTKEIVAKIAPYIQHTPTFVLLEGVLFFLDTTTTNKLFEVFSLLQKPGDQIGSVSYQPEVASTEVYNRLLHYFDRNNQTNELFAHQTIPSSFYHSINGYTVEKEIDEFTLAATYAPEENILIKEAILNESLYILKRR
ncbi:class I SAM-dependent methyltransferase [Aquimarina hainanensis]|uniref:Class I SAM-dependent methyltransferase n=1 Tax=Aquimarina hainanensis TaxID=1578017 RepID=A0ABW5NAN6_9FLAO|nr:class I SAM-dependent methyltransferase [Aquimarina sp. TRL1]QKX03495.1 adenosine deaminase [Aquimarina sp. TRL1]